MIFMLLNGVPGELYSR